MLLSCGNPVQPAAEADERADGAVDVPDAVQQPAPAAQRPGIGQVGDDCSTSARSPACRRLSARWAPVSRSMVRRSPTGACQCWRPLAIPRNPRSSRLTTSTLSSSPCGPASRMSSCSWQLPGQPPSSHAGRPRSWRPTAPGRCGRAAWCRTAPSGWPTHRGVAPGWPARPRTPPRRPWPSRKGALQARPGW
jgi:hypothetical protein